jgi:Na+/H+ antiporter NhaC
MSKVIIVIVAWIIISLVCYTVLRVRNAYQRANSKDGTCADDKQDGTTQEMQAFFWPITLLVLLMMGMYYAFEAFEKKLVTKLKKN